jgi:branched-chain amino acid transport system permease protein
MNYALHLIVYFDIFLIVALSLNLIVGYAGLLTLAHAGFFSIGGYAYAVLNVAQQWSFVPAALAGMIVSAALSVPVSLCSWRLKGDFFVLATLAVQAMLFSALSNWTDVGAPLGSLSNVTNGPFGISGIGKPALFGYQIATPLAMAIFSSVVAAVCALSIWRLTNSPWGTVLRAMRDDELAARGLGKNTRLLKMQVFAISSGFVAIAGAIYASHIRYIDPSSASLDESILMLSMVVVGGIGNFRGPVVGAALLILLPELLRAIALPDTVAANLRMLIYGVMLILMMMFRPQGIAGEYRVQ